MIEVQNLRKHYADAAKGRIVALDGLHFTANPGEVFGLLGPNGAGKTTALRILSTMLKPSSGEARICGYNVATDAETVRRNIGFVSVNTGVYDRMTAWEAVQFFGRLNGMSETLLKQRMEIVFAMLHMNDMRDLLGARMSTGMRQKVSIARAIVHDPRVIIFDEATNGLDVLAARSLIDTVRTLAELGKCVVFSTHIMREAEKLCHRIAIMHRGRILTEGTLSDVRTRYGVDDLEELFFELIGQGHAVVDEGLSI